MLPEQTTRHSRRPARNPRISSMCQVTPESGNSLPGGRAWVSLSSGTMGGEVWRPALNQISRNIRRTALGWEYDTAAGAMASQQGVRGALMNPIRTAGQSHLHPGPALLSPDVLGQLDEGDDKPTAHFTPHLGGPHLHEHFHALQHAQPCQQLLLGQRLQGPQAKRSGLAGPVPGHPPRGGGFSPKTTRVGLSSPGGRGYPMPLKLSLFI